MPRYPAALQSARPAQPGPRGAEQPWASEQPAGAGESRCAGRRADTRLGRGAARKDRTISGIVTCPASDTLGL